jgi:hypothetical protein
MAQNTRELNVNINVDITETIRGLKAIQREAKKAAQALRELEAVQVDAALEKARMPDGTYDVAVISALTSAGINVEFQTEGIRWKREERE